MNKNAPVSIITLRSRKSIGKIFSPQSPARKNCEPNLFSVKALKLPSGIFAIRGHPWCGRHRKTTIVSNLTPMSQVIPLMRDGWRVLIRGYPNTLHYKKQDSEEVAKPAAV